MYLIIHLYINWYQESFLIKSLIILLRIRAIDFFIHYLIRIYLFILGFNYFQIIYIFAFNFFN